MSKTNAGMIAEIIACVLLLALFAWRGSPATVHADPLPEVQLDAHGVGPRALEKLTENSIIRDYADAWATINDAFDRGDSSLLNASFVGEAKEELSQAVNAQLHHGLHSQLLMQHHALKAVFYAPEGDVLELHDTATYTMQLRDGEKTLYNQNQTVHYVVLMTPGADRWLVRQLQAVAAF